MWTRSAKSKETGLFTVVAYDWAGAECFRGEFADASEAERAGQDAERRAVLAAQTPSKSLDEVFAELDELEAEFSLMTNEQLLAELSGESA
jgi:hypothetical protein